MKNRRIHQGQVIGTGEKVFNAGMAILGIVISLVVLYPIYYVLIASLSQPYYVENGDVMFAIRHFTLASYKEAIKKSGIWLAYGNTIFYTVAGVVVNMLFTTTMAYALSKKKLVFRKFFTLFTIFTMWFQPVKDQNGHYPWVCDQHIQLDYYEEFLRTASRGTGGSGVYRWSQPYYHIFQDLFTALQARAGYGGTVLRVDRVANASEAAIVTQNSLSSPTTVIYAMIIIAIVPMLIVFPFVQKYFKTGVTVGGVKG